VAGDVGQTFLRYAIADQFDVRVQPGELMDDVLGDDDPGGVGELAA
jgi:hypothetical protein